MTAPNRRPVLAKIHIARKELGLEPEAYRDVLQRVTGHASAADCTDAELERALDEFRRLGWKPRTARPVSQKPFVRMIYAIWMDMAPLLGSGGSRKALRSYVQRQTKSDAVPGGVAAPEFLDAEQATLVIEGLKAWRARLRQAAR